MVSIFPSGHFSNYFIVVFPPNAKLNEGKDDVDLTA
jgi:hypothetical protein